jgi:hypothetical protein
MNLNPGTVPRKRGCLLTLGYDYTGKTFAVFTTEFLGLQIYNLNWKKHIEYIISNEVQHVLP